MFTKEQQQIYKYISDFQISVGISAVTNLGIPDILSSGAKNCAELSEMTGARPKRLSRLLDALASIGFFSIDDEKKIHLTPLSRILTKDAAGSLASSTKWYSDCGYQAWLRLYDSLMEDRCPFEIAFGKSFFHYIKEKPEISENFDDSQVSLTEALISMIIGKYPFEKFGKIIDVGGGNGQLITAILEKNPHIEGILFDMPEVLNESETKEKTAPYAGRIGLTPGSFFEEIPNGGDLYLLKYILHDWPDDECLKILRNCREAVPPDGTLLIIEIIVSEDKDESFSKWRDLEMMTLFDAKERTESEYKELLNSSGFGITRTISLDGLVHIIEVTRKKSY